MNATTATGAGAGPGLVPAGEEARKPPASPAQTHAWPSPKTAWFTLSMIGMVTIFGQMDRAIFYLLVASIKRDLEFSDTQMSLLMGIAYSGAYFLCGLPIAGGARSSCRRRWRCGASERRPARLQAISCSCSLPGHWWEQANR
jgi:hypothetical protein